MTDTISQNGQPQGETPEGIVRRVTDALGREFTDESLAELVKSGIPLDRLHEFGIRSVRHPDHIDGSDISDYWVLDAVGGKRRYPGMLFEWRDLDRTIMQFRPDQAVEGPDGELHKYVLPKDCGTFIGHWRRPSTDQDPVLLVEGTKQGISAACWAPAEWGVSAIPGCQNWMGADLTWAEGRRVMVLFDADLTTNRDVHDAASKLKEALEAEGAEEVSFVKLAGAKAKEGLDDVLGRRPEHTRTEWLRRICANGVKKLGRPPARKSENEYMGDKGLLVRKASLAVLEGQPAALASGSQVALYRHGVYIVEGSQEPLLEKVTALLGDDYRPTWRSAIEDFLIGELSRRGARLPDRMERPLLNCKNGMLDLVTGELLEHSPAYLSAQQIPVNWDPDAQCPRYLAWAQQVIPDQFEALEEVSSTMLDSSRTPLKAVFLFGPSHSGKSTWLRLLQAIAGHGNYSAVSLHQLADNKFMAAPIYQKMLNVGADLSSAHVSDLSLFKMLSGEDPVEADRKYGRPFRFTNQALFAFSANELPTVSESSNAYVNRIAPFLFPYSFEGREDPTIEAAILANELPGILARWVRAWQAYHARGRYLPQLESVAQEFETRSDRVARWVATRCDVFPDAVDTLVGPEHGDSLLSLYNHFKTWVKDDGSTAAMTRPKFAERLRAIKGVGSVRLRHRNKNLGLNVVTHTRDDAEIGLIRAQAANSGVGGVGSVGSQTSSPYVRSEVEMIKDASNQTHGENASQATLPTPPTPALPDDEEAAAWLSAVPSQDAPQDPTPVTHSDAVAPVPHPHPHPAEDVNPIAEESAAPADPFAPTDGPDFPWEDFQ